MKIARIPVSLQVRCKDGIYRTTKNIGFLMLNRTDLGRYLVCVHFMDDGKAKRLRLPGGVLLDMLMWKNYLRTVFIGPPARKRYWFNKKLKKPDSWYAKPIFGKNPKHQDLFYYHPPVVITE